MNVPDWAEQLQYYFTELVLFKIQDVGVTLAHITVSMVILLLAVVVSKVVRAVLRKRVLRRLHLDSGIEYALLRFIHYLILGVGFYVSLSSMNIPLGALVGLFAVVGVGIGFGLQNVASNFISGIILLLERPVKIGDRIEIDDVWGDVKRINLRTTLVKTPDDISIIVPNSKLLENNVINYSHDNRSMRLHIPVGVAYGSDIDLVTRCLEESIQGVKSVDETRPPEVWFSEFGDSSLNFDLLCWIDEAGEKYRVLNQVNRNIDALFRKHDIEIPFPQRDLHLRSADAATTLAAGA